MPRFDAIYVELLNKNVKRVYNIKENNLLHFLHVCEEYSYRYLKYHNMLDLSMLHYDIYPSCYLEGKIFPLRHELIMKERIKIFIHFDDEKLMEKYKEKVEKFKEQKFIFTEDPNDEEIGIAYINLFGHNRFAADLLLRNIPIIDISWIGKFQENEGLKCIDPFFNYWIYPIVKVYDRVTSYDNELPYIKMGYSYKALCTGHISIYWSEFRESLMFKEDIELKVFLNNGRFFKNIQSYSDESELIPPSSQIYLIYNGLDKDNVDSDLIEKVTDNFN